MFWWEFQLVLKLGSRVLGQVWAGGHGDDMGKSPHLARSLSKVLAAWQLVQCEATPFLRLALPIQFSPMSEAHDYLGSVCTACTRKCMSNIVQPCPTIFLAILGLEVCGEDDPTCRPFAVYDSL